MTKTGEGPLKEKGEKRKQNKAKLVRTIETIAIQKKNMHARTIETVQND